MDMETIAELLKNVMENKEVSRYELSKRTGLPETTIGRIVKGVTLSPRLETLKQIADGLGVQVEQLTGYSVKEPLRDYSDDPLLSQIAGTGAITKESAELIKLVISLEMKEQLTSSQTRSIRIMIEEFTKNKTN